MRNSARFLSRLRLALAAALSGATLTAVAAINSVTGGDTLIGNRSLNLVVNGSFENSGWAPIGGEFGAASYVLTSTGTLREGPGATDPVLVPAGWTTSGGDQTYAIWGNDSSYSQTGLIFSAPIPDGTLAIYTGNSFTTVSTAPLFASDGVVGFSSTPTFTHVDPLNYTAPFRIGQTVSGLSTSDTYLLDVWISGEDASVGGFPGGSGVLELDITGEAPIYLGVPSGVDALGLSQRYYVDFQPSAPTVTFTFINYGHLRGTSIGDTTEAILDDVILNRIGDAGIVPEASNLAFGAGALALAAFVAARRR